MKKGNSTILIQFSNVVIGQEKKDFSLSFNHMALSVKDVNVSAEFYTNVLNLEIIPTRAENVKWISLGDGKNYTYYQFSKMILRQIYILLYQQILMNLFKTHKNEYSDFT
jgi:hypothetical protein